MRVEAKPDLGFLGGFRGWIANDPRGSKALRIFVSALAAAILAAPACYGQPIAVAEVRPDL